MTMDQSAGQVDMAPKINPLVFQGSGLEPWTVKEPPVTRRGIRTRDALVAAARTIFERDGFINARLVDICKEADYSIGTFYFYFDSKEAVLVAVLEKVQDEMLHPGFADETAGRDDIRSIIDASNRAYLTAYRRNARLMMLLEQVATLDPGFAKLRLDRSRAFASRNAQWIASLQDTGHVDKSIDPHMTSWALSSMLSRMAYFAMVLGEPLNMQALQRTATDIWLKALGIPEA
jgi:AcrR family transcriptional regulator